MFWSLSFHLMPDEKIIANSSERAEKKVIKEAYSVVLTNKRAIFRFDGLGSFLTQTFFYNEILDVRPDERLFIKYLRLKTANKYYFLHINSPAFWSDRIIEIKNSMQDIQTSAK